MAAQTKRVTRSQAKRQVSPPPSTSKPTTTPSSRKAAAPPTPPPSTTKARTRQGSSTRQTPTSPKGSKPTGVKKQVGRPAKKATKSPNATSVGTDNFPVFKDARVVLSAFNLDPQDPAPEKTQISPEELAHLMELGESGHSTKQQLTWHRPFPRSGPNDRLEASFHWQAPHLLAAWTSLSVKIQGLAGCVAKELPAGLYVDTASTEIDEELSQLCTKPDEYWDDKEGSGRFWLIEAYLWSRTVKEFIKPEPNDEPTEDLWSTFVSTAAKLRQYAGKPSLFAQLFQIWSAKSAMLLYTVIGKRPSDLADAVIRGWLNELWESFSRLDESETDSEVSEDTWSGETQAMIDDVVEQVRFVEVLHYGLECHTRVLSRPPGHPLSDLPCECERENLAGEKITKATRIDLWVQPGLQLFPVRDGEPLDTVSFAVARGNPLHSIAARVVTGAPKASKK